MPKPINIPDHKNRFIRFNPIVTMGNIVTATAVLIGAVTASQNIIAPAR